MTDEEAWFMAFWKANLLEAGVVVDGDEVRRDFRCFGGGNGFLLSDLISRWCGAVISAPLTFLWSAPFAMVAMPARAVVVDLDAEALGFFLFAVVRALGAGRGVIAEVVVFEIDAVRIEQFLRGRTSPRLSRTFGPLAQFFILAFGFEAASDFEGVVCRFIRIGYRRSCAVRRRFIWG